MHARRSPSWRKRWCIFIVFTITTLQAHGGRSFPFRLLFYLPLHTNPSTRIHVHISWSPMCCWPFLEPRMARAQGHRLLTVAFGEGVIQAPLPCHMLTVSGLWRMRRQISIKREKIHIDNHTWGKMNIFDWCLWPIFSWFHERKWDSTVHFHLPTNIEMHMFSFLTTLTTGYS